MSLYLRFHKNVRRLLTNCPTWIPELDIKSWIWSVWLVYSIGLMVLIAVTFNGVIEGNHAETCTDKNGNFSGNFDNVNVCRTKDEIFLKNGRICGSLQNNGTENETFCWKTNKVVGILKTDEFFGPSILKITLCATPVLMLLLLKSARAPKPQEEKKQKTTKTNKMKGKKQNTDKKDEPDDPIEDDDLKDLYFRATLNLFDGMEMLEELLEHGKHGIDVPQELENAILAAVCLFYCFSFLELLHLAFRFEEDKKNTADEEKNRKKYWIRACTTNTIFQISLNALFLALRLVMWFVFKRDAAIFIAKNLISIVMNLMPIFIARGLVDDKSDVDTTVPETTK